MNTAAPIRTAPIETAAEADTSPRATSLTGTARFTSPDPSTAAPPETSAKAPSLPETPSAVRGGMFSSLHSPDYRTFAIGSAVSNVGTWMQRVGQAWLVLALTGNNATALGIVTGLQFLPMLLATPMSGTIADIFDRRRTLLATAVAAAACSGLLALAALTGHLTIHGVYLAAFVLGIIGAIESPVRSVFLHDCVEDDDLPNAIALNSASFNAARLVGPALAGILIAGVGAGWAIGANAVSYLAVAVSLLAIGQRARAEAAGSEADSAADSSKTEVPAETGSWKEAIAYIRARRDFLLVFTIVAVAGAIGMNFAMSTPLMSTEVFGRGPAAFGVLSSIMAVGSLAGALLAARRPVTRLRVIVVSAAVFGILEILAGLAPTYFTFALLLPLVGLASLTMVTAATSYIQLAADAANRGRVMAAYSLVFMGGAPFGAPLIGFIGEHAGARWTLLAGGLITVAAVGVSAVIFHGRLPRVTVSNLKETAAAFA